jgi:hypothetical protein
MAVLRNFYFALGMIELTRDALELGRRNLIRRWSKNMPEHGE